MYPFEKLEVWRIAQATAVALLGDFDDRTDPRVRTLSEQAWRASCSIPANIAEGSASASSAQFARYLTLALGSACELESHLRIARDARLLRPEIADERLPTVIRIKKMLWSLREKVRQRRNNDDGGRKKGGRGPPSE